jgi:hypothetical protein
MERLGVGALVETARSPSATPIERGARDGAVDRNDASVCSFQHLVAVCCPGCTSSDVSEMRLTFSALDVEANRSYSPVPPRYDLGWHGH